MRDLKEGYIQQQYDFPTKRFCQFLHLIPDEESLREYKYWHESANIWKEIPEGIRKTGILNMEIFLLEDKAFMIIETPLDFNWDEAFGRLATYEKQAEWESFVSKYQVRSGKKSDEKWQLMERIFNL